MNRLDDTPLCIHLSVHVVDFLTMSGLLTCKMDIVTSQDMA